MTDIDQAVATKIMKWKSRGDSWATSYKDRHRVHKKHTWLPSSKIAKTQMVIDKMKTMGFSVTIESRANRDQVFCQFEKDDHSFGAACGDTMEMAVCQAALVAHKSIEREIANDRLDCHSTKAY